MWTIRTNQRGSVPEASLKQGIRVYDPGPFSAPSCSRKHISSPRESIQLSIELDYPWVTCFTLKRIFLTFQFKLEPFVYGTLFWWVWSVVGEGPKKAIFSHEKKSNPFSFYVFPNGGWTAIWHILGRILRLFFPCRVGIGIFLLSILSPSISCKTT